MGQKVLWVEVECGERRLPAISPPFLSAKYGPPRCLHSKKSTGWVKDSGSWVSGKQCVPWAGLGWAGQYDAWPAMLEMSSSGRSMPATAQGQATTFPTEVHLGDAAQPGDCSITRLTISLLVKALGSFMLFFSKLQADNIFSLNSYLKGRKKTRQKT